MSTSTSSSASWYHFLGNNAVQVEASEAERTVRSKYPLLLHKDERIEMAFKSRGGMGRDKSYFTSHRILIKDGKGIGSKRKNYVSVPYYAIQAFSVETAGQWDGDVDLKVWSTGKDVSVDFARGSMDIFALQQYLNTKCNWMCAQGTQDYVHSEPLNSSSQRSSGCGTLIDWLGSNATQVSPMQVDQNFKTQFPVLMKNERVELAFKTGRDFTVFTDHRLLVVDVQGLFGKKVEFYSFPWRSFSGFAVETAGAYFDRDTEINLFTNICGFGRVHQDFRKGQADIFGIQKYLSNKILGEDTVPVPNVDLKQGHVDPKTNWWFRDNQRPLDAAEMDRYYHQVVPLLQGSERVEMAFKGRRDVTLFTTKRIIDIDPKGITGQKVEYSSVPWKSVLGFGVKTAGKHLDTDCEAFIFTDMMFKPSGGEDDPPEPFMSMWEMDFNKNLVNVIAIKKYLSARCLGNAPNVPIPQNVFMISQEESGLEKFLSKIGDDQRAIDPREINNLLHVTHPILMDEEQTIMAFKAGRDITLFTNIRIMILDTQGWSGKKVEYTSIPYKSIRAFSAESAGGWDRDSEIGIYTRNLWSLSKVKLDFRKGKADIIAIQKFLSSIVMGNHEEAAHYLNSREPIMPQTNPASLSHFLSWINNHSSKVDASVVDAQLHGEPSILLDSENVLMAFRQGRDMFVYTDKRILLVDVQGFSGKKVQYKSIPWKWCQGFEFETAGNLDRDAEFYFHNDIPGKSTVKHSILVKDFDIYEMGALIFGIVASSKQGKVGVVASGTRNYDGFERPCNEDQFTA